MEISPTTSLLDVEVIAASPEQEPILAHLLELYAHDFSEFIDLQLDGNGRFGYKYLPLYWKESDRYPFLIRVHRYWAGFVFVRQEAHSSANEHVWDMAEFFVVRGYRRRGIGMKVAHEIWKQFPGRWSVRVIDRNAKAKAFWQNAIREYAGEAIDTLAVEKNGEGWHVFSFFTSGAL